MLIIPNFTESDDLISVLYLCLFVCLFVCICLPVCFSFSNISFSADIIIILCDFTDNRFPPKPFTSTRFSVDGQRTEVNRAGVIATESLPKEPLRCQKTCDPSVTSGRRRKIRLVSEFRGKDTRNLRKRNSFW